VNKDLYIVTGG